MLRAGVVMAVAAGTVAVLPPAPAMAAKPSVQITSLSNGSLKSGEKAELSFRVTNNPGPAGETAVSTVNVSVSLTFGEVRCEGRCDFTETIEPGQSREYTVTLAAGNLEPGKNKNGKVQVQATVGSDNGRTDRTISARGPDQVPMVKEIIGKVRDDDTGRPVAGAAVAMSDPQNHKYDTVTDRNGNFRFVSSAANPISPGSIDMLAQKDGFKEKFQTTPAKAGESVKVTFGMKSTASPSPSATATPTATPTEAAAEAPTPDALAGAPQLTPTPTAGDDADSGGGSLLYILLGGLLVAAGVGAIVLVLLRRKENDADAEPSEGAAPVPATAGAAVPAAQGVYHGAPDATRAAAGHGGADATMIARGGVPPSLADAPTMLQRAVPADPADEFPDPYGAPLPGRPPVYGGPGGAGGGQPGGWDNAGYGQPPGAPHVSDPTRAAGMAGATAAAVPVNGAYRPAEPVAPAGAAYGPPGGYGPAARADQYRPAFPAPGEPNAYPPATGAYAERYDDPTGRYEAPSGGYPAQGYQQDGPGYGSGPAPEGYGAHPAGGQPGGPTSGGPSGAPAHPGYEPPAGGYGGGRYGGTPAGGYDGPPAPYGSPAGNGYEPPRGRHPGDAGGGPGAGYPGAGHNGYEQQRYDQAPGYEQARGQDPAPGYPGGYDQSAGYEQRGGYDRTAPRQSAGPQGADRAGYYGEQPPSRHGAPPPPGQPPIAEQRRPLDWLDD